MASYPKMTKAARSYTDFPNYKSYFDTRFGAIDKPMEMKAGSSPPKTGGSKRSSIQARHGPGGEAAAPVPNAITTLDSRLLGPDQLAHPNLTAVLRASSPFALSVTAAQQIQGHLVAGKKVSRPDDDSKFHLP